MFRFKTIARMKIVSRIGLGLTTLAIAILLLFSYYGQRVGSFTVDVSDQLYVKEVALSELVDFAVSGARLEAQPLSGVQPMGIRGNPIAVPVEIEAALENIKPGDNNGNNFLLYSFYIKNTGDETLSYNYSIYVAEATNFIDHAIRVMVIKETDFLGIKEYEKLIYARSQSERGLTPGEAEIGALKFFTNKIVVTKDRYLFQPDMVDRYILALWVHGEDADATDVGEFAIVKGRIRLSMKFSIIDY